MNVALNAATPAATTACAPLNLPVPELAAYIAALCARGGPHERDYPALEAWFGRVKAARDAGTIDGDGMAELRAAFGSAWQAGTMQGRSFLQQHGYAGDFEIIDEIYAGTASADPQLRAWDAFFHAQGAPRAVRNRKAYFKSLVLSLLLARPPGAGTLRVLNIASGPCRDVAEFFDENPDAPVHFTCVDVDGRAIAHAAGVCERWSDRISFVRGNALRVRFYQQFDLVWSAGLFDYFEDRVFVTMLTRMAGWTRAGGSLVVGNFSDPNPSAAYQEFADWFLRYRTPDELTALGAMAGCSPARMAVESEEEGINLFLRCVKG